MSLSPTIEISLRQYSPLDVEAVSTIICRCLRETNIKDYPLDTIEHMCEVFSPTNLPKWFAGVDFVVVASEGQKVVGTGSLKDNRIMTVFVSPDDHGKRVGSKVMDYLEEKVARSGHSSVDLNSSISSLEFYKSRNYVETERVNEKMGGEMIVMRKKLEKTV